jgi:chaperonin GroES
MGVGFRAVQDRVVVKRVDDEYMTDGGLYIPDLAKERPAQGVVVATGPGKYEYGVFQPVNIQPGDHVLFGKFSGQEVKVGVDEFLILREEDVFLVLTPKQMSEAAHAALKQLDQEKEDGPLVIAFATEEPTQES